MNKPQILIVEDDNAVANLIAATLETQEYAYKRAENGAEAVPCPASRMSSCSTSACRTWTALR